MSDTEMMDIRVVAQAVAWLLGKSDAPLTRLKIRQLLYLADRESLDQTGFPITSDTCCLVQPEPASGADASDDSFLEGMSLSLDAAFSRSTARFPLQALMSAKTRPGSRLSFMSASAAPLPEPVSSRTLELMTGKRNDAFWSKWVRTEGGNNDRQLLSLGPGRPSRDAFDHLSDFETDILDQIWSRFGAMESQALVDHTHNLPEHAPTAARADLQYADILMALGYDPESARDQAADIASL